MDDQKGGQSSTGPSWNAWSQAAAGNASAAQHTTEGAGMTAAQRQQQTVAEIARRKVLDAYDKQARGKEQPAQQTDYREPTKQAPTPQINPSDWRKYHSAWQNYYQKYYGDYYRRAAKEYVARERLRIERDIADRELRGATEQVKQPIMSQVIEKEKEAEGEESRHAQEDFKAKIQKKVAKRARKMRRSRHFVPLAIGFTILVLGLLFQYNQVIIANAVAYMSPGGSEVNDITALDPTVSASVHDSPTLMIPKLNVEVPVVFGAKNDVNSMATAMSNGVAHFSIPGAYAKPGEIGNFVISGHSAGNVYQRSDYKFIFSGLTRMGANDLIYMDYNGTRYTYRVTGTKVVNPSDVASVVAIAESNPGKPMITLITCTPLGTSKYRLLVFGEQIHPSYEGSTESSDPEPEAITDNSATLPKNDDSPLEQFWKWLTGQS